MRKKKKLKKSLIVGVINTPDAQRLVAQLLPNALDALEWRADCLPDAQATPSSSIPWILTVRHPLEGGQRKLSAAQREKLFFQLLPGASYVDLELRSMHELRHVRQEVQTSKRQLIASFHDFKTTPSSERLQDLVLRATDIGADILKVATWTSTPEDIARLLALLTISPLPLAVMGMGPLGFSSRLLFASCGSVLNYGWLHTPNAQGQWSALELKKMLEHARE